MARSSLAVLLFASLPTSAMAQLAPEHAVLKELAGNWIVTSTSGTGGAAAAAKGSEQTETSELICGGLWLETVTRAGDSELVWLTGFDPSQKQFVRVRVGPSVLAAVEVGEWNALERTITWRGRDGLAKRVGVQLVVKLQKDAASERMSIVAANGSETVMGERTFARAKPDAAPAKPKASQPAPPTSHHELLARLVGDWDCAISATMPDVKAPMRSRGRMREDLVGDGWWLRSTFRSEIDGAKIEGRGLTGFNLKQKCYVRYWVDSGSAVLATSTCALDESGKKLVGSGTLEMAGRQVESSEEWELGDDLRHCKQRLSVEGKDAGTFENVMTRRPEPKQPPK